MAEAATSTMERESRINTRAQRMEARALALLEGEDAKTRRKKQEEAQQQIGKGKQQILDSEGRLETIEKDGSDLVTLVRVQGDDRENARRIIEEAKRQERRQKLLDEAENSAKRNAAVAMKWASLLEKDVPQDLIREMEKQRDTCNGIIRSKDKMIEAFQMQLRAKDDEYVKALKKQAEDIDFLLERMGRQFIELRKAQEDELQQIEQAFSQERAELLEAHHKDLESLYEKRRQMEQKCMEIKMERQEEDAKQLEALRTQDAEEYNILKIKLETEIQMYEQQLEEMRSTYQLNTEKLEYNLRVLHERDIENATTISQQKRKLARLQDALSNQMAKYAKLDKHYRQKNLELTEEYKRITDQFKDLQAKFRHFEIADQKKYRDVWAMNSHIVSDLVRKILLADKIVHEQQLGLNWFPPNEEVLQSGGLQLDKDKDRPQQDDSDPDGAAAVASARPNDKIKRMLSILTDEAGFLVEQKVLKMFDGIEANDQQLLKVDSILKAIGVEDGDDVEQLLSYFVVDEERGEFIHPNDALKAIKQFVEDHQLDTRRTAKSRAAVTEDRPAPPKAKSDLDYWNRMANIVPEKTVRIWTALERQMLKYNQIVEDRATLISHTATLRRQNDELKALLNQYLSSRINDELNIPPTALIYGGSGAKR